MKRFNVVFSRDDGGIEVHPMKEWIRQHPEYEIDPSSMSSHQVRDRLKKAGWAVQETSDEVRLIRPETSIPESAITDVLGNGSENEDFEQAEATFGLEFQLRDFIAQNFGSIAVEGKRLRLHIDPTGRDGIEYPSATGPIDLLAIDDSGAFVVFELKRARVPDKAVGQLARYMGWVKQTIGKDRDVRGVIVAKTISDKLRYAVSVFPNVSLFEYEVEFHLKPAHSLAKSSQTG